MNKIQRQWPVPKSSIRKVLICCFIPILAEGYDVGVIGAILPALANDPHWGLSPIELGALSSWALVGMLIGAMAIGSLSDRYGRRVMVGVSVALFAGSQLGVALAPSPEVFGLFRFLGGLGMGGIIPVCAALTIEYSPPEKRSLNYGIMYSGYSLGILISGLSALVLLEEFGWRLVVGLGAVPLVILPFLLRATPESLEYLVAKQKYDLAQRTAAELKIATYRSEDWAPEPKPDGSQYSLFDSIKVMFSGKYAVGTVGFWISLFCGLLLVYGLNTWLPSLMRSAGYDLGSSLTFLIVFSMASAVGGIFIGSIADRWEKKTCLSVFYLVGACGILSLMFPNHVFINYVFVSLAGVGSIATSLVLTGWVADYYPGYARGTATGFALSFARLGAISGPLLGGWIGSAQLPFQWNFIVFAGVGVMAALAVAAIPRVKADHKTPQALSRGID